MVMRSVGTRAVRRGGMYLAVLGLLAACSGEGSEAGGPSAELQPYSDANRVPPGAVSAPAAMAAGASAEPASTSPGNGNTEGNTGSVPLAGTSPSATEAGGTETAAMSPAPSAAMPAQPPPPEGETAPGAPLPSAGCGKSGRPEGGVITVAGDHIYSFPPSYDGTTPMALIFGFHANNNPIDQIRNVTRGTPLEANFVMAFPKSVGAGWTLGADAARLDGWYDELVSNYCIDTRRVYATGHSSGAQFIVQLLCRGGEDRFQALAPVASSAYCASWDHPIPTLLIHGSDDRERANTNDDANGRKDLAPYLASNSCSMTSAPYAAAACNSGGTQVNPGCVSYQGCTESLVWCSHNDPNYSMTNHGWPCFASQAMFDFFSRLP